MIFISESEVEKADPPFLNRFEKYRLRIEDVLSENERILHLGLVKWIRLITVYDDDPKRIRPELIFVNYNLEYLYSLILRVRNNFEAHKEEYDDEKIINICQRELIKTSTFDFPIAVHLNVHDEGIRRSLIETYYEIKSENFKDFCQRILSCEEQVLKNVVYTYTQISDDISYPDKASIKELKLSSFKSEMEIVDEIKRYFSSESHLLVIRLELAKENAHLLLIKHLLLNSLDASKHPKGRHLMIIIHLQRFNAGNISVDTLFHNWESVMFDDLNKDFILPIEFIEESTFQKLRTSNLMAPLKDNIAHLLPKCFSKIKYNVVDGKDESKVYKRRNKLLKKINSQGHEFINLIQKKIDDMVDRDRTNTKAQDWKKLIILEEWIRADAVSPVEAMNLALAKYYEGLLMNMIYKLEKECLIDAYFEAVKQDKKELVKLWCDSFQSVNINLNERLDDKAVEIDFSFGLKFPFSTYEEPIIQKIQDEVDEVEKQENRARVNAVTFDKLTEASFFGVAFYSFIFDDGDLYNRFLHDQVHLYMIRNKIRVGADIAVMILDYMHMSNARVKFQYFLTSAKEFCIILGVVEVLLALIHGKEILFKALRGFCNLNETEFDSKKENKTDLPKYLLIHKNNTYYQIESKELPEPLVESQIDLEDIKPTESDSPFLEFFFANIVQEISSCKYLSQFGTINEIKAAFRLIEEKIIKTRIYPDNMELFRPWIDVMRFIEVCDQLPDVRFHSLLLEFGDSETEELFLSADNIKKLVEYLAKESNFVDHLEQSQKDGHVLKLQTQLYKNLMLTDRDDSFIKVLDIIDKDEQL